MDDDTYLRGRKKANLAKRLGIVVSRCIEKDAAMALNLKHPIVDMTLLHFDCAEGKWSWRRRTGNVPSRVEGENPFSTYIWRRKTVLPLKSLARALADGLASAARIKGVKSSRQATVRQNWSIQLSLPH